MKNFICTNLEIEQVFDILTDNGIPFKAIRPEIVFNIYHPLGKPGCAVLYEDSDENGVSTMVDRLCDLLTPSTEKAQSAEQNLDFSSEMKLFLKKHFKGCDKAEIMKQLNEPPVVYEFNFCKQTLDEVKTFWAEIFAKDDNRLIFSQVRIQKSFKDDSVDCKILVRPCFEQKELITKLIYPLFVKEPNPQELVEQDDGFEHFVFIPQIIDGVKYSEKSLRNLLTQNKVKFSSLCDAIKIDEKYPLGTKGYCIGRNFCGEISELVEHLSTLFGLKPEEFLKEAKDSDINFTLSDHTCEQTAQSIQKFFRNFSEPFQVVDEAVIMTFSSVSITELKLKATSPVPLNDVFFLLENFFPEADFQN